MDFFERVVVYCLHAVMYEKFFKKEALIDSLLLSECQTILRGRYKTFIVIFYGVGSLLIELMYMKKFKGKLCVLVRTLCYIMVLCIWEILLIWTLKSSGTCPDHYLTREFDWDRLWTLHFPFCFALVIYLEFLISYVHSVDVSLVTLIKGVCKEIKHYCSNFGTSKPKGDVSVT